uniref:Putative secreted peptide n=1 Tax=Anopheles braziliensis TaxID=58242 RepID=A0A2M3ZP16_9DIPT
MRPQLQPPVAAGVGRAVAVGVVAGAAEVASAGRPSDSACAGSTRSASSPDGAGARTRCWPAAACRSS